MAVALSCFLGCVSLTLSAYAVNSNTAAAHPISQQSERVIHESWGFKDGAPEEVTALAQTADGLLWLGTPAGLFRFDGVRFEPFRSPFGHHLLSTYVFTLFAPPTGGLWVGYAFGGFGFINNGTVTNYVADTGSVYSITQDQKGVVWAGTGGGLWRFDRSAWQHIAADWNAPLTMVCQARFDHDGVLWVLTDSLQAGAGKALFYLSPGERQFRKAAKDVLVEGFTLDADNFVLTTHDRESATGSGIIFEESLPAYPMLRRNSEQQVDRDSSIWFLPKSGPVLRHPIGSLSSEALNNSSTNDSDSYGIEIYRYVHLVDREGAVWIGGQKGIHRFSYTPLIKQDFPNADATPFFVLAPDDGGIVWVSAGDGNGRSNLYRVANGQAALYKAQPGLSNVAYRGSDKTFWFAGEGGLWHMVNGNLTRINLPPDVAANARSIQSLTQDLSGGLWVSIQGVGLYRYADGAWTPKGGHSDLRKGVVIEFTDTLGNVWFGYTKNRLAVLKGSGVKTFGPEDGIRVGNVTAIYGRGSKIWIGGEFGLQQFDTGKFHSIEAVDTEWLRGITGIVKTANGDLWLNALGGVFHIFRAELEQALVNPQHKVSGERLGRREGLPGLPPQLSPLVTAVEGTDGRLWFTVTNGVVSLDPTRASHHTAPPPVTIQSVSADDVGYRLDGALKFPAHTASVQIAYDAVSLSDPEAIRFRYKLREVDRDWQPANSKSVSYRNLPPGSYHFLVNASDANGSWSNQSAETNFSIAPAYYQTTWFRAVCTIAFLTLLWTAYRWRLRLLRHQFEMTLDARVGERTRIARELHDTLLQSFHGLLLRFQTVAQLLPGRPDEAKDRLDNAIEQAADAITEGRDAVQGLRDSTIQSNDLAFAVSALGEELATESTNKRPQFSVTVEGASKRLHPILRDEIYKIAAESLRNAFRHAEARDIEVEIRYDHEQFRLRVRDNGKGVDPAILSSSGSAGHYGLPGMRERAKLIGAELSVWSEVDTGTEVELCVPASIAYTTARRHSWYSEKFGMKPNL